MYRIGFCPQCGIQIMVKDTDGAWRTRKKNFAQIDISFDDGHRVRTTICKVCSDKPNYEKLLESILHPKSQACGPRTKERLAHRICPATGDKISRRAVAHCKK